MLAVKFAQIINQKGLKASVVALFELVDTKLIATAVAPLVALLSLLCCCCSFFAVMLMLLVVFLIFFYCWWHYCCGCSSFPSLTFLVYKSRCSVWWHPEGFLNGNVEAVTHWDNALVQLVFRSVGVYLVICCVNYDEDDDKPEQWNSGKQRKDKDYIWSYSVV